MREKDIEKYLAHEVKKIGGRAYKFISPGNAGVPDRLVCLPGGEITFVELKAPGGRLTPLQERQIERLDKLGHKTFILKSKTDVDRFVHNCKELMPL